jgi:RNA polymerase-binding protein DksA
LLNKKDLKHFEERLLEDRKKLMAQLGYLEKTMNQTQRESSGDLSAYSFHMADMGTDAMEREKAFLFASAEGRLLYSVNEALRRLYRNEYGICESCGKEIGKARLDAVPYASLCVSCQEKQEKSENAARG